MRLLLYHFIHLYFISEFEVLFYLYYIFPYEKRMVYNLFTINDIPYNYNTTLINNIYEKYNCQSYFNEMNNNNDKLFNYCFYYLISINILLFLIIIYDMYYLHLKYSEIIVIQDNNDGKLIEITNRNSDELNISNINIKDSNNDIPSIIDSNENLVKMQTMNSNIIVNNKDSFIKYYLVNSKVVNEIKKLLQFILLIGAFEYLFFSYIVNEFKIANTHSIVCNIIKNNL